MKKNKNSWLPSFLKNIKLFYIICAVLMFLLGVAIASYLSYSIKPIVVIFGLIIIMVIQLLEIMIDQYIKQAKNPKLKNINEKNKSQRYQLILLAIIASALMILAIIIFFISRNNYLSGASWTLLTFVFILSIVKSIPYFSLKNIAFQEIIEGIIIVGLVPSLSFSLLTGELNRFLPLICLPLLFIYYATKLALAFPMFASDVSKGKNSILISLGWQRGEFLHDLFILLGFCALGLSSLLGLPWLVTWPALLALPVGIFEIWQLFRLSQGSKPNWNLLKATAFSLFTFPAYLLIFSLFSN